MTQSRLLSFRRNFFWGGEKEPVTRWGYFTPARLLLEPVLQMFLGEDVASRRNQVVVYEGDQCFQRKPRAHVQEIRGMLGCSIAPGAASLGAEPEQPGMLCRRVHGPAPFGHPRHPEGFLVDEPPCGTSLFLIS